MSLDFFSVSLWPWGTSFWEFIDDRTRFLTVAALKEIAEGNAPGNQGRKNNFAATDVARTLVSAAPRLISALRRRPIPRAKRVEMSLDPADTSVRATSPRHRQPPPRAL